MGLEMWISDNSKAILGSAVLFGMTKDLDLSVVNTHTTPPTTVTTRLRCVLSGVFLSF